jgi:hypothetical protein
MGLDISHNTWHGAYSAFMTWRTKIAFLAGFPPLELMEGFYWPNDHNPFTLLDYKYPKGDELDMSALRRIRERLPIKWDLFGNHPLVELLTHPDCEGYINYSKCGKIADELEKLLPLLEKEEDQGGHIGNWKAKTETFIVGLRLAAKNKERLQFR